MTGIRIAKVRTRGQRMTTPMAIPAVTRKGLKFLMMFAWCVRIRARPQVNDLGQLGSVRVNRVQWRPVATTLWLHDRRQSQSAGRRRDAAGSPGAWSDTRARHTAAGTSARSGATARRDSGRQRDRPRS
jgi:hypothetical protein